VVVAELAQRVDAPSSGAEPIGAGVRPAQLAILSPRLPATLTLTDWTTT